MSAEEEQGGRAPPAVIGPYRVRGVLGEGGMGIVYRAERLLTGEPVALKTVREPREADVAGLRRESWALWRLRHPGVVRIVRDGRWRGRPWFAMELLDGATLKGRYASLWPGQGTGAAVTGDWSRTGFDDATVPGRPAERGGAPRPRAGGRASAAAGRLGELLAVVRRLCLALAHVHACGIVHRDLKPSNVFLRSGNAPVLADFGLACRYRVGAAREPLEAGGLRVGTVHYMAPEQVRGEPVDPRADLYALGCLLYEGLTGRRPFEGPSADEVAEQQLALEPARPGVLVSGLPPEIEALVLQLLAKERDARPAHAAEVAEALAPHAARVEDGPAPPRAVPLLRPRTVARGRALAGLCGRLEQARAGRGGIVLVEGAAGLGKTFLLGQIARRAGLARVPVVIAPCAPGATPDAAAPLAGGPLHPFRPLLRALADRCRRDGPGATERLLGAHGAALAAFAPGLGRLLPGAAQAAPEAGRALRGLGHVIDALCREGPLVVVLDDLHHADALSLAFLHEAAARGGRAALFLAAFQLDRAPPALRALAGRPGVSTLCLSPLDDEAVVRIAAEALGCARPPAPLISSLRRAAAGNPAAAIRWLRQVIDDGRLARRGGRWICEDERRVATGAA